MTYSLDAIEGEDGVFLLRRDEMPIPHTPAGEGTEGTNEDGPQPTAMLVTDTVHGLRFRYLDGQTGQWMNDWDTHGRETPGRLPIAVEVALYLYDGDGGIHDFATIVDLPLAPQPTPSP